jgi:hypothetical protein
MKQLSKIDREALERAIEIARRDPEERGVIDRLMKMHGWFIAAVQACYHCQRELIRPRLWQPTPADIDPTDIEGALAKGDDGLGGGYRAALLLKRMLRAGLSRYEPRPVEALERARNRQRADGEPEAPAA